MRNELAEKLQLEAISWKQKLREKWFKEGDKNTRFFHCLANHRRRNNYVEEIKYEGEVIFGNEKLREAANDYFQ